MAYRPYPDRGRALRQVERTRAAYLYGRVPQRHVVGFTSSDLEAAFAPFADLETRLRRTVHQTLIQAGAAFRRSAWPCCGRRRCA